MLPTLKCPVIALEEHYWDKELAALFVGAEGVRDPEMLRRLYDLGELRLGEMDEAGIDVQILSAARPRRRSSRAPTRLTSRGASTTGSTPSSPRTRIGSQRQHVGGEELALGSVLLSVARPQAFESVRAAVLSDLLRWMSGGSSFILQLVRW
jgi:hypothetical protein